MVAPQLFAVTVPMRSAALVQPCRSGVRTIVPPSSSPTHLLARSKATKAGPSSTSARSTTRKANAKTASVASAPLASRRSVGEAVKKVGGEAVSSSTAPPPSAVARGKAPLSHQATTTAASSLASPAARPIVIYRGPPGMKRWMYYFVGCVFTGASAYQGYILTQHMSWPLISRDREANPPKLASPWARYGVGALILGAGGMLGFFMFWSPTRLATRITLYPSTSTVGVRTAAPPFRTFIPAPLRRWQRGGEDTVVPLSPHDNRERLHPFSALLRRDRTSAVQIADFAQGRGTQTLRADSKGLSRVPSSLLLGEGDSWGYQLEAAPHPRSLREEKNQYKLAWSNFKMWIKGNTDWSSYPQGSDGLSREEGKAKATSHPKEPWFLDRANFDRLFPVRQQ